MTRPSSRLRARAFALAFVGLGVAAVRLVGCGASSCEMAGTCCCGPSGSATVVCTIEGPACASGFSLRRGDACLSGCGGADAQVDALPDALPDASDGASDGAACDTVGACCCKDNLSEHPSCSDAGAAICGAGYGLFRGDDCLCLADRQTPCCPIHALADAATDG